MKCSSCRGVNLEPSEIAVGVIAQKCPGCGGLWLNSLQFGNWITSIQAGRAKRESGDSEVLTPLESKAVKLCLDCGRLMTRYKVGNSLSFALDRCGSCGGTWFDCNEWQALQQTELWDRVHLIFSPAWQMRVRQVEQEKQRELHLQAILGAEDLAQAKRVRIWLDAHPHRAMLLAFLNAESDRGELPKA